MLLHLCLHLCHYVPLYQSYFAVPVEANMRVPVRLRWHMTINLSEHVLRNVSRFRLRAHTLRVDRAIWTHGAESTTFDKCDMNEGQDEQHVLFKCTCPEVCQLGCKYAPLFQQLGFSLAGTRQHCAAHASKSQPDTSSGTFLDSKRTNTSA